MLVDGLEELGGGAKGGSTGRIGSLVKEVGLYDEDEDDVGVFISVEVNIAEGHASAEASSAV